jgi:hypothetical protein
MEVKARSFKIKHARCVQTYATRARMFELNYYFTLMQTCMCGWCTSVRDAHVLFLTLVRYFNSNMHARMAYIRTQRACTMVIHGCYICKVSLARGVHLYAIRTYFYLFMLTLTYTM